MSSAMGRQSVGTSNAMLAAINADLGIWLPNLTVVQEKWDQCNRPGELKANWWRRFHRQRDERKTKWWQFFPRPRFDYTIKEPWAGTTGATDTSSSPTADIGRTSALSSSSAEGAPPSIALTRAEIRRVPSLRYAKLWP